MKKPKKGTNVIKPARKEPTIAKHPGGGKRGMSKGKTEKPGAVGFNKPDLAEESVHGPYGKSKHRAAGKPNQDSWKISKKKSSRR